MHQRAGIVSAVVRISGADSQSILTADTYERHLDTRFTALEAASKIKQWNQAYQLVEEIHSIMGKVDRPIKPKMMADYYKSLSDMFLLCDFG